MKNKEHTKYYNSQGTEVPSVTTVIKLLDKPQLVGWANYLGFNRIKVEELLAEKADYGTRVHSLFEKHLMDYEIDDDKDLYEDIKYKLEYIKNKLSELGYEIESMELQMQGEEVGGTLDLLVRHTKSGKYMVLDLKTSKDVYNSMFIQLGGYSLLLEEKYGVDVSAIGIILISKDINDKKFFSIKKREDNITNEKIFTKLLDIYYLLEAN